MKRHISLFKSLILAAAGLMAVSCTKERDMQAAGLQSGDEVRIHFRASTSGPQRAGTRAADDPEWAVNRVAVLVFEYIAGDDVYAYMYRANGRSLQQDQNASAYFEAYLTPTENPVRLLFVANYPDGAFDELDTQFTTPGLAANDETYTRISGLLSSKSFDFSQGITMTGVADLTSLSAETGVIRFPLMRSVAKATVAMDLEDGSPEFTFKGVTAYRTNDTWLIFPNADSVENETTSPMPIGPSIVESSTPTLVNRAEVTIDAVNLFYTDYFAEIPVPVVVENPDPDVNPIDPSAQEVCLIVRGQFEGDTDDSYYRIDFGVQDDEANPIGQILRNYWYQFTIVGVEGSGWASADEAAANPSSGLRTTVTPWNGGGNSSYYFGDNDYIKLSPDSLYLDAIINATDAITITTSEVPFTITSQRQPGAGQLDTSVENSTFSTDIMSFTLTPIVGAPAGEQLWTLEVTALTDADSTIDYLILQAGDGLMTIRIKVQRNPPPEAVTPPTNDPTKRLIRVYSLGTNTYGSFNLTTTNGVPAMLRNTAYFGPTGTVQCGGFQFVGVGAPTGTALETLLQDIDIVSAVWRYNPSAGDSQIIAEWLAEEGHILFLTSDDAATSVNLRPLIDGGMVWDGISYITYNASNPYLTHVWGYGAGYSGMAPAAVVEGVNNQFMEGVFGNVHDCAINTKTPYDANTFYMNTTNSTIHYDLIPLMVSIGGNGDNNDVILWGVNPTQRVVYLGEAYMYHVVGLGLKNGLAYDATSYINVMWSNLWAWAVNTVLTENYDVPGMTDVQ